MIWKLYWLTVTLTLVAPPNELVTAIEHVPTIAGVTVKVGEVPVTVAIVFAPLLQVEGVNVPV